jgi:hypothetical protein
MQRRVMRVAHRYRSSLVCPGMLVEHGQLLRTSSQPQGACALCGATLISVAQPPSLIFPLESVNCFANMMPLHRVNDTPLRTLHANGLCNRVMATTRNNTNHH